MYSDRRKRLKITTFAQQTKTLDLVQQLVSVEKKDPHSVLKTYAQNHFHAHTLFGLLQTSGEVAPESKKVDEFQLFLYRKPIRNHDEALETKTVLTINAKDEISIQNGHDIEKLILLKVAVDGSEMAINLDRSIQFKQIVQSVEKNPYPHTHFVFLSLMNTTKAQKCYDGFIKDLTKIKNKFQKDEKYSADLILVNEVGSIMTSLKEQLKTKDMIAKLKMGKIYFLIHAHCSAGSDSLSGESTNGTLWDMPVDRVAEIIKSFKIDKNAYVDIDLFACHPGQFDGEKPAFCLRLKDNLDKDFSNISVKGNVDITYSIPRVVAYESPRDVAVFGKFREPLSSKKQLMYTEPYHQIMDFPIDEDKKSSRNELISAFKKHVDDMLLNEKSFIPTMVYQLKIKWNQFNELEIAIEKAMASINQFITDNKINNPELYNQVRVSLVDHIENIYRTCSFNLDFSKAFTHLEKVRSEYYNHLVIIHRLDLLKKQMQLQPGTRLFKKKTNHSAMLTISQAEMGIISYEKALQKIYGNENGGETILKASLKMS